MLHKLITNTYLLCANIPATDPDPRHAPALTFNGGSDSADDNGFSVTKINPDETLNISFLLIESALRVKGNHLGSLWIRPDQSSKDDFKDIHLDPHSLGLDESIIAFPVRPIQREFSSTTILFLFTFLVHTRTHVTS